MGGRVINRKGKLFVTVIYWFLAFFVALLVGPALAVGWIEVGLPLIHGDVAKLVSRLIRIQKVRGSKPRISIFFFFLLFPSSFWSHCDCCCALDNGGGRKTMEVSLFFF